MFSALVVFQGKVTLSLIQSKILGFFRSTMNSYVEILVEVMTDRND